MNKKNYVKNNACYQFDYIMKVIDINARDIFLDEKKKIKFMSFHTKLLWVQYHCILDSIK